HPHGAYASCQLRICRDGPARDCAAEQGDELAPPHVAYSTPRIMDLYSVYQIIGGVRRNKERRLMSERGQTRSFGDVGPMSGFPKSGNARVFSQRRQWKPRPELPAPA